MPIPLRILFCLLLTCPVFAQSPCADSVMRIAFGSCNYQKHPQPLWHDIARQQPDLWIWLGDNVYADTYNMDSMRATYQLQKRHPDYKVLLNTCPVIGLWDDHDYGFNDAGATYPHKQQSQQQLLDFLDEPQGSARRRQEGIYTSYQYHCGAHTIKIILLDTRYFKEEIKRGSRGYRPDHKADLLGEAQWQWLEKELRESTAGVNIICSGTQVIQEQSGGEKWANYPASRQKLFDLIADSKAEGVLLLSGDRHFAELARISLPGYPLPVYEVTSSGMTHFSRGRWWKRSRNRYRVEHEVRGFNYGLIEINAITGAIQLQILGASNRVLLEKIIQKTP